MKSIVFNKKTLISLIAVVIFLSSFLYLEYPPSGGQSKTEKIGLINAAGETGCNSLSGVYRDKCLYAKSIDLMSNGSELNEGLEICSTINDVEVNGYCYTQASLIELKNRRKKSVNGEFIAGSDLFVRDVCSRVADKNMQGECFFKSAEEIALTVSNGSIEEALKTCQLSQRFEYDCVGHMSGRIFGSRGRDSNLAFCRNISGIYRDVSPKPIRRCYSHYFVAVINSFQMNDRPLCGIIDDCYVGGDGGRDDVCVRALAKSIGKGVFCGCPQVINSTLSSYDECKSLDKSEVIHSGNISAVASMKKRKTKPPSEGDSSPTIPCINKPNDAKRDNCFIKRALRLMNPEYCAHIIDNSMRNDCINQTTSGRASIYSG